MTKYIVLEIINSNLDAGTKLTCESGLCNCNTGDCGPWVFVRGVYDNKEDAWKHADRITDEYLVEHEEYLRHGWELTSMEHKNNLVLDYDDGSGVIEKSEWAFRSEVIRVDL